MKNNLGNKEIMAKNIRRYLEYKHMTIIEKYSFIKKKSPARCRGKLVLY